MLQKFWKELLKHLVPYDEFDMNREGFKHVNFSSKLHFHGGIVKIFPKPPLSTYLTLIP